MRVAVLADIHGNAPALEAVLAEVDRESVDVVVLNGDLADSPMPVQTLELLEGLGDRAVWVRGNTDRWLVDAYDGRLELQVFPPIRQVDGSPGALGSWSRPTATGSQTFP